MKRKLLKGLAWFDTHVPPGVRTIAGVLLVIGGFFGFLPFLGFWMIPLGLGVIALDFRWLRKKLRKPRS